MKKAKKIIICVLIVIIILLVLSFIYLCTGNYKADSNVLKYLNSTESVKVSEIKEGYFFDGPSNEKAVVFYPGAKVEYKAYAKLMYEIAESGMDCFLIKMPFNMAIFNVNKADKIINKYEYDSWYIGGHSMGGAMACNYASSHADKLKGVIALAGYPTGQIPDNLELILIYGNEDKILSKDIYEAGRKYYPSNYRELVIEGGNHAFFANYGEQKGDGKASISCEEQQKQTIDFIFQKDNNSDFKVDEIVNSFFEKNDKEKNIEKIDIKDVDGEMSNYTFTYNGEVFSAIYTPNNWKIIDSYKITNKQDIIVICEELIKIHPVKGEDGISFRTAEDMAYEWVQHNLAYSLLPEGNEWRNNAKDVDLNPEDQGKNIIELYEKRSGIKFDLSE